MALHGVTCFLGCHVEILLSAVVTKCLAGSALTYFYGSAQCWVDLSHKRC
jgi:hypothetical protein